MCARRETPEEHDARLAGALALATAPRAFDADVWRILARWLAVPAHLAQVCELAAQADEEAPGAA